MQINVLSFTKPLQSMILIAALSCCCFSAARADGDDTYTAAHSFGTDVLSVFCQNSLQAMEKWTMDFISTVASQQTNYLNQAVEQNKDFVVQDIEAYMDYGRRDSYIGLHTFWADDGSLSTLFDRLMIESTNRLAVHSERFCYDCVRFTYLVLHGWV